MTCSASDPGVGQCAGPEPTTSWRLLVYPTHDFVRRSMWTVVVGAVVLGVTAPASASVIYIYTGNPFTQVGQDGPTLIPDPHTTSDRVAAVMELLSVLGPNLADQGVTPVSFSLSDGVSTLTGANATSASFRFTTDGGGNIVG